MKATRFLPASYRPAGTLEIGRNLRLLVSMNFLGIALLLLFGWLFLELLFLVRPGEFPPNLAVSISGTREMLQVVFVIVLVVFIMVIVHEGLHGLFFWIFTRSRPVFAFKGVYASASAPGWYLPRNQYLITGLAPFVLISLVGALLLSFVPRGWLVPILLIMTLNASGAVVDLTVCAWLLTKPASCLALDDGDKVTLFVPNGSKPEKVDD